MLFMRPSCNGTGYTEVRSQSRRKSEGEEAEQVDCDDNCNTCDGSGQLESPPAV